MTIVIVAHVLLLSPPHFSRFHRTVARFELKRVLEGKTRPAPDDWYRNPTSHHQSKL